MKCRMKGCGNEFQQYNSLQRICVPCAIKKAQKDTQRRAEKAQKAADKTKREKHRNDKERVKRLSDCRSEAQDAFNRYIKARDRLYYIEQGRDPECISCGTTKPDIQYAAGHMKTRGAFPELAFDEENVHLQCNKYCNRELSGNIHGTKTTRGYLEGLKARYGEEKAAQIIERLNSYHPPLNYTKDDFIEIKKKYAKLARELKKKLNNS